VNWNDYEENFTCPFCNYDHAHRNGKTIDGEDIVWCAACDSKFGAETNVGYVPIEDGGDDEYDQPADMSAGWEV
jgi:transcription elongation factor Elf1